MKTNYRITVLLAAVFFLSPWLATAQTDESIKQKVDTLVKQHYIYGIQYVEAKALGPEAVPYLLELLNNPAEKEFWVNIIVTLGFIESDAAFDALASMVESTEGEVDVYTLKAMLSIPFAIGCIASSGDDRSLDYLIRKVDVSAWDKVRWRYRGQSLQNLLGQETITALAVSGRSRARQVLRNMKDERGRMKVSGGPDPLMAKLDDGLEIMDRIEKEGRSGIFNPRMK